MRLILPLVLAIIAIAAFAIALKGLLEERENNLVLTSQLKIESDAIGALSTHLATVENGMPKTAIAAATAPATDDAKIKELVKADVQEEMQGMRGNRGGQRRQPMDAAAFASMLQNQIGIEEAKAAQLAPLLEASMNDARKIFADGGTQEEMAAKRKDLRAALEAKTSTILSADEQTKFTNWLDQREQMFNRGRRGGGNQGNAPQPRAEAPAAATTNGPGATVPGQAPAQGAKPSSF